MSLLTGDLVTEAAAAWHALPVDACLERLRSARGGLTRAEAERRLAEHGPNELQGARRASPWALLLDQFQNVLIIILLIAVALSAVLGHGVEAVAIAVIVLFAVLLGFVQEYRAERAHRGAARDGRARPPPSCATARRSRSRRASWCPGDVILLHAGDRVPADARLVEAVNLQVEEAALTGESVPVEKQTDPTAGRRAGGRRPHEHGLRRDRRDLRPRPGGGRRPPAWRPSSARSPGCSRRSRPAARRCRRTSTRSAARWRGPRWSSWPSSSPLGLLRGQPFVEMLIFGIALAVAVVPEALPAVVTISLAIGVQRMVKRNALMRRLPAVETLGSTSVICSDKTGTLTRDEMTVRKLYVAGRTLEVSGAGYEPVGAFSARGLGRRAAGAASRGCSRPPRWRPTRTSRARRAPTAGVVKGDPTEGALVVAAAKAGLHKADLDARYPRVDEIPFTSETKRMTTLHADARRRGRLRQRRARGHPRLVHAHR